MGICCSWPVERIVVSQFHTSGAPRVESQAAQILKTNYYSLKQYASLFCDTGLFTWRWHNQFQAGQLPQQWQEIQNTKRDITSPSFLAAANGDGAGAKGGNWQYLVQSVRFWWITQEYIRRQRRTYTSKRGLICHHQRLEITMTREAFYQPSKFESVQYFCQYLHICTYEVTGNKLKCATWHLADWPRCTGRIWSLWLAVLESETEDYFSIDSSSPRAWYNLPSLCAPLLEEQVLVCYHLSICWGNYQVYCH